MISTTFWHGVVIFALRFFGLYRPLWVAMSLLFCTIFLQTYILKKRITITIDGDLGKQIGSFALSSIPFGSFVGEKIGSIFDDKTHVREGFWNGYYFSLFVNFVLTSVAISL